MTDSPPRTDIVIVRELLAAGDGFVSGTRLAELVGISRVSIWGHMEKLRGHDFEVEAVRRRGYRLLKRPEGLDEYLLRAALPGRTQPASFFMLPTVDSTNSEAERRLAAGEATPLIILARSQSRGRGRLGRRWPAWTRRRAG